LAQRRPPARLVSSPRSPMAFRSLVTRGSRGRC
jgi:hypothetical protein